MNKHLLHLQTHHLYLQPCLPSLQRAFELLADSYSQGGKLLVCGNGGSASDAEHIVGELMKGFKSRRAVPPEVRSRLVEAFPENGEYLADNLQGALPAISLVSQTALMTAYANDVAPDMIFAQQVYGYGIPGDVLIGITASGRSRNILNTLQVGRALGLGTIGLTGARIDLLDPLCDVVISVPCTEVCQIQEGHLVLYHTLCAMLEQEFFGE